MSSLVQTQNKDTYTQCNLWLGDVTKLLQNKCPILEEDIPGLIFKFQDILCLHQWRIKHQTVQDERLGSSLMVVKPNRDRGLATIYIRQSIVGSQTCEFGPLLLHEMLHLVLEPIAEEHSFQMEYACNQRTSEYDKRFIRSLEKVVEALTSDIARLVTLKDQEIEQAKDDLLDVVEDLKKVRLQLHALQGEK